MNPAFAGELMHIWRRITRSKLMIIWFRAV